MFCGASRIDTDVVPDSFGGPFNGLRTYILFDLHCLRESRGCRQLVPCIWSCQRMSFKNFRREAWLKQRQRSVITYTTFTLYRNGYVTGGASHQRAKGDNGIKVKQVLGFYEIVQRYRPLAG